jgi:hypothetical protein
LREVRQRPVVVAVASLFTLIGLGARAPLFGRAGSASVELPSGTVVLVSSAAILAMAALVVGYLLVMLVPGHRWRRAPDDPVLGPTPVRPSWAARVAMLVLPAAILAGVVFTASWVGGHAAHRDAGRVPPSSGRPEPEHVTPAPHAAGLPTLVVVAALAALVISVAWLVWVGVGRTPRAAMLPATAGEAELARIAADAAADLDELADPRTTILCAYRAMAAQLAAMELGRRRAEGPREHIARVLPQLGVAGRDARRLERVFEVARFTGRPLDARARGQAVRAFRGVQAALGNSGR